MENKMDNNVDNKNNKDNEPNNDDVINNADNVDNNDNVNNNNTKKRHHLKLKRDTLSTIADHSGKGSSDQACIVYKFQSRPPYEGFVLILVIVVVAILLLWWLNSKLKASEQ
jgi:hypothetical protein